MRFHALPDLSRFLLLLPAEDLFADFDNLTSGMDYLLQLGFPCSVALPGGKDIATKLKDKLSLLRETDKRLNNIDASQPGFADGFSRVLCIHNGMYDALEQKLKSRSFLLRDREVEPVLTEHGLGHLVEHLRKSGPENAVQIARAEHLLEELFTSSGRGVMVSLGYQFEFLPGKDANVDDLKVLIERGFGRKLKKDYFQGLQEDWSLLREVNNRAALVLMHPGSWHYLDKAVVSPEFNRRGLGSILLDELCLRIEMISSGNPRLAWRARHDNPYLGKYSQLLHKHSRTLPLKCGTVADDHFVYHFMGLDDEQREEALQFMRNRPGSFEGD